MRINLYHYKIVINRRPLDTKHRPGEPQLSYFRREPITISLQDCLLPFFTASAKRRYQPEAMFK